MSEIVRCPVCGKRIFDLQYGDKIAVSIKCPHCKNIVTVERA